MECKHFSAKFFFLFVVVGSALEVGQNVRLMYIHCKWIDALHILTRPSFVFVSRAKEKIDAISFFFFFAHIEKMQFVPFPSTVHVVEPIRIGENGSHIDGMKIRLPKINTNERVVVWKRIVERIARCREISINTVDTMFCCANL